jgi:hypothetical protein
MNNNKLKKAKKEVSNLSKSKIQVKKDETLYLIYMTPQEIKAREIHDYFVRKGIEEVHLWEELNILQLELANQNTVEFEPLQPFQDKKDLEFLEKENIKTLFALTIEESDFKEMKDLMIGLLEELEGFIATDSEDFSPTYTKFNM